MASFTTELGQPKSFPGPSPHAGSRRVPVRATELKLGSGEIWGRRRTIRGAPLPLPLLLPPPPLATATEARRGESSPPTGAPDLPADGGLGQAPPAARRLDGAAPPRQRVPGAAAPFGSARLPSGLRQGAVPSPYPRCFSPPLSCGLRV